MDKKKVEVLNVSLDDLVIIAINVLPPKEELYYHCVGCGIIYDHKEGREYVQPLLNLYQLTGLCSPIPWSHTNKEIGIVTSGICVPCYDNR